MEFWIKSKSDSDILLGIGNFCHEVITTTKNFSTKTHFFVRNGFEFYTKNVVPSKFRIFEKGFLGKLARFSYFR